MPQHGATGSYLAPSAAELFHLRLVASGKEAPSLIIRHGKVLSVHTGELLERDVVVKGRHIAAITPWDHFPICEQEIEAKGLTITPGMIDAHIHIEYTKLTPGELARLSIPRGTTTILADPNCTANVAGIPGMDFMRATDTPLRIFRQASHKTPYLDPPLELGGKKIAASEVAELVQLPTAVTLGESNPFSLDWDSAVKQAAALEAGKRITGHTALLANEPLWAYAAGGIGDDHNASLPPDVKERMRLGMMITVMSGSMNSNIGPVFSDLEMLDKGCLDHLSFCADDKFAEDLNTTGHIDLHIRESINEHGLDPIAAWRMATWNPARYYRVDHLLGSVTPAKLADLLLVKELKDPSPVLVIVNGKVVAKDGAATFKNEDAIPDFMLNTIHLHNDMTLASTFKVNVPATALLPNGKAWVQAMEMYDGYFKRAFHAEMVVADGNIQSDTEKDVLKITVIDRHHGTASRGIGFVKGFGLKEGAIACTTNCENQNLVVIGATDKAIAAAVGAYLAPNSPLSGGGFVVVSGSGEVLSHVALPVGGNMSNKPFEELCAQSIECDKAAESIGCTMPKAFMIMSFVGLPGVPDLGLTEITLVETAKMEGMNVVLDIKDVKADGNVSTPTMVCCRCPSHKHDLHRNFDPLSYDG